MKKLIFVLFVVLSACAEERVAPSFDSLEGWWSFSHKEASGSFEIVKFNDVLAVDNSESNVFTIRGVKYSIKIRKEVVGSVPDQLSIYLMNSNSELISLYELEPNKEFTQISTSYWTIKYNGTFEVIRDPITITR